MRMLVNRRRRSYNSVTWCDRKCSSGATSPCQAFRAKRPRTAGGSHAERTTTRGLCQSMTCVLLPSCSNGCR
jgi:hypothetical protein